MLGLSLLSADATYLKAILPPKKKGEWHLFARSSASFSDFPLIFVHTNEHKQRLLLTNN